MERDYTGKLVRKVISYGYGIKIYILSYSPSQYVIIYFSTAITKFNAPIDGEC